MNEKPTSPLNLPQPVTVKLASGKTVVVREIPWVKLKPILSRLADVSGSVVSLFGDGPVPPTEGALAARLFGKLPMLVDQFCDFAENLVMGCIDPDQVDPVRLEDLSTTDFLSLLDVAIAMVLTEDLVRSARSIQHRVRTVAAPLVTRPSTGTPGQ